MPKLEKDEYSITYYIDNNDKYLQSIRDDSEEENGEDSDVETQQKLRNENPSKYASQDGLLLKPLVVEGYKFKGWFTAQTGGELVTEITAGSTGNKVLFAQWEKEPYTIHFISQMVPVSDIQYTVGDEIVLPPLTRDKYVFVGWSDEDGALWNKIPAGTTGELYLYANWVSTRNKAQAVSVLDEPIICEDPQNGLILFTYEIGEIQNVPLYTTLNLQCANGIISTTSVTGQTAITEENAMTVAQTISNATTNSSSWTISEDWNEITEVSEDYIKSTGKTREQAEKEAKSESNTYNLSKSSGGSSGYTNTNTGSYRITGDSTHSDSSTVEKGDSHDLTVDGKVSSELTGSIEGKIPGVGSAEIGTKIGAEIGASANNSKSNKTTNTGTDGWSSGYDFSGSSSSVSMGSKSWNTSSGYSNSKTTSKEKLVSEAISETISNQYHYGTKYSHGGENSETQSFATTDSQSDEFSSTVTYSTSEIVTTTREYSSTGNTTGDYRMVQAGTVHVFAVVGYSIADSSYFVYTYNVMDDRINEYLDYSFDGTFSDYETSIIPFEVPSYVNDYVNIRTAKTDGLQMKLTTDNSGLVTGTVNRSNPPAGDEMVLIPAYISVDNNDGTFSSVKVDSLKEGLFSGNEDIVAVQLSNYITEIPDSAFEGCTSLQYVIAPGVKKIGNNAFKGCTSLKEFTIPVEVTELGANAFEGVNKINVVAANIDIAQSASNSRANSITLDISNIGKNQSDGVVLEIGEIDSFELLGKDKEFKNLRVKSDAMETIINGVAFTGNSAIPLELSSETVTLNRVTVDSSGLALVLKNPETNLILNRSITVGTQTGNAMLCRNVNISSLSSGIVGELNVFGNILKAGDIAPLDYVTVTNGEIIDIDDAEFDDYLSAHRISFDANGGTVNADSRLVPLNTQIGELPVASRDFCKFDGWFTEISGGEQVTEETLMTSITDIVLYAHWTPGDVSAWVLASNMPSGAQVVSRKYKYTLTSTTTSSSSSLSGWTKYDTSWVWGPWGSWSSWGTKKYTASDSRDVGTREVFDKYNYYRYAASYNASTGSKTKTSVCKYKYTYALTAELASNDSGGYKLYHDSNGDYDKNGSKYHSVWKDDPFKTYITQYRYRDRSKVYTYYYKKEETKESTTMPSGSNISNVQEWVQYIAK